MLLFFFFFNDTATTEIYTLSLHDALPISLLDAAAGLVLTGGEDVDPACYGAVPHPRLGETDPGRDAMERSEEHTSELQSLAYLVCRLLLEKKKTHPAHAKSPGTREHVPAR